MKRVLIHLGIMTALSAFIAVGTLWYLDIYTNHGSELIKVQNLEGKTASEAIGALKKVGLVGMVIDTVYKEGAVKNTVVNQNPIAGLEVKPGRKVYLITNTNKVPMVAVPDLAGKTSLNQAISMLLRRHLKVGKVIKEINSSVKTKSDEPVLDQYASGTTKTISPNTLVERNSSIDLVIGVSADHLDVPDSTVSLQIP